MKIVRFGIIGVGGMGTGHATNMPKIPEVKLTAVCDIDQTALKVATDSFDVPGFDSATKLIQSGLVDAVIVATPHYFHGPIAIEAMKAGLHVISEKPMSVQVSVADEMIRVAKQTGRIFSVMFQMRSLPEVQAAHKIIREGRLGEIYRTLMIDAHFRSQAYYDSATWRATWKGEGGGVLMNQAPHGLDLFTWLGGMPSKVTAHVDIRQHKIEVEDTASALVEYPNGATGFVHETVNEAPISSRWEFLGEKGKIVLEEGRIRFWEVPAGVRAFSDSTDQMWGRPEWREVEVPLEERETGHAAIVRNVARAIIQGEPLISPGEEALPALELADAILLSGFTKRPVKMPVDRAAFDAFIEKKKATSKEKYLKGKTQRITDPQFAKK
jgi:predicted dehydrogenase